MRRHQPCVGWQRLEAALDSADRLEVLLDALPVRRAEPPLQRSAVFQDGVEHAPADARELRGRVRRAGVRRDLRAVHEQAVEDGARIELRVVARVRTRVRDRMQRVLVATRRRRSDAQLERPVGRSRRGHIRHDLVDRGRAHRVAVERRPVVAAGRASWVLTPPVTNLSSSPVITVR